MSVYTHPSPSTIYSAANQGTFSMTAGQSQGYYNTWNWEWGRYDVSCLQILTCGRAVPSGGQCSISFTHLKLWSIQFVPTWICVSLTGSTTSSYYNFIWNVKFELFCKISVFGTDLRDIYFFTNTSLSRWWNRRQTTVVDIKVTQTIRSLTLTVRGPTLVVRIWRL